MSSKLRVGVVGVGYLGKFHARIYSTLPDVELVGVVDANAETAQKIAADYKTTAFAKPEDLIGKVDAVSVVVPTIYHLEVARPFLENGVHMLMEKPIAPSYEEGEKIVALAEKHGVTFQVGHLERYNAGFMELVKRVSGARFIEATRIGGFSERATDVDVVTDLMIHDLDLVMALVQSPIRDLRATGVPVLTDHADIANVRMEFENGAVANVTASRISIKKQRRIRVFGKNSYHALDFADQQVEEVIAHPNPAGGRPEIKAEKLAITPTPPLDAELADFVNAVRAKRAPLVDGRTGLEALRIALMVKEKMSA
ncbi:MAG: Gfo/Idh/MocA family oxidoreductase [Gammaproteobacteria bacterium]|nr:Gfo/Idh/MocA family oxidoreductase [Gammaproteobacteria bacterium]